jgi:hypothetical protein
VPSFDHFQRELRAQFDRAEKRRAKNVVVNSGELHRAVGGYARYFRVMCFRLLW